MHNVSVSLPESNRRSRFGSFTEDYQKTEELNDAQAVLVRSAAMHDLELPEGLEAIARAGAGVNNIPLEKCADQGNRGL